MKILVAEDDPDQLELRTLLLQRSGFTPLPAASKAVALELARSEKPCGAVVDLRLPDEFAGLGLVRELKELNPAIWIVVLTGADLQRLERRPERSLMDEVLVKGSSSGRLIDLLKRLPNRS